MEDTGNMMEGEFQIQVIKYIATTTLPSFGSFNLGDASYHFVRSLKQPVRAGLVVMS